MKNTKGLLEEIKQHHRLSIKISSDKRHHLPAEVLQKLLQPHRMSFYFLVFVEKGSLTYTLDLQEITVTDGELLFVLPNQVFAPPATTNNSWYFKLAFDENTLALLPHAFSFFLNPMQRQKIAFDTQASERVRSVFGTLDQLLHANTQQTEAAIILAHLYTLLTEVNCAYLSTQNKHKAGDAKLSKYIEFKLAVESHLTAGHSVHSIAEELAVSNSNLYGIVKEYAGVSPKEFMTNRLMIEAQRKLRYGKTTVKELAYELGFNDPDYFSRLFKKNTGKSISEFLSAD